MPGPLTVRLLPAVESQVLREAATRAPEETGGLLVGYPSDDALVVTASIGPGPNAVHDRRSFAPDHAWQAEQLAALYEQSGRRIDYLGDWHTHPGGRPALSRLDRETLRRIALHGPARCPTALMLVVSGGPVWQAAAFTCQPGRVSATIRPADLVGSVLG